MARSNEEIAKDLDVAASWNSGTQQYFLSALAAELRGEKPPTPTTNMSADVAAAQANAAAQTAGTNAGVAAENAAREVAAQAALQAQADEAAAAAAAGSDNPSHP